MVSKTQTVETRTLPPGMSAQKAEVLALTWALEFGKRKTLNISTDSWYVYASVHAHGAIWKKRRVLTAANELVKFHYTKAPWGSFQKGSHGPLQGTPEGEAEVIRDNNRGDTATKEAAQLLIHCQLSLLSSEPNPACYTLTHTKEEMTEAQRWGFAKDPKTHGCLININNISYPKIWPTKPLGKLTREPFMEERPYIIGSWMCWWAQVRSTCPTCTVHSPLTRHPMAPQVKPVQVRYPTLGKTGKLTSQSCQRL